MPVDFTGSDGKNQAFIAVRLTQILAMDRKNQVFGF
jgi:hypothetical protein